MKTVKSSMLLLFIVAVFVPYSISVAGTGNYGDSCNTVSECDDDKCCLDPGFCGDMLNKCVLCNSDEDCNQAISAEDGDIPEWLFYSCNNGICRKNCRFIEDCSGFVDHALSCDNDYCYECYENSDCSWRANPNNTGGKCLNHICVDCLSDDDCIPCIWDTTENICLRNHCNICYNDDGDYMEEDSEVSAPADGDTDNEEAEIFDGDTIGTTLKANDGASCRSGGGAGMLALLLLLPLTVLRRSTN